MKIDQSNVMRVLFCGLALYWLTVGTGVAAVVGSGNQKTIGLGLGIMAIIAASFCTAGAMLLLSGYAFSAVRAKWKVSPAIACLWTLWLVLPLPAVLLVAGFVFRQWSDH
jgi:hypothetical protein